MYGRGGVEVYLYTFFNLDDKMGGRSTPRSGRLNPGKRVGTHCIVVRSAPGPVWAGAKKSRPHQDSISGPSIRSESLYRLCYPGDYNHYSA